MLTLPAVTGNSLPHNKQVISSSTSLGQRDPFPATNERVYRASDVDSGDPHHRGRRPSHPLLATVAKCTRVQTTRLKPNLSVRIPKPLVTPSHSPSPIIHTPTSPVPLPSSAHPDGNILSRHDSRRNGHQQLPTCFSPHTPTTPLEQVIVRRPTDPPAIKPRHSRGNDNNGDEAYNRRVERLFAPTPTEWTFSSTLNRVPAPLNDCFDLGVRTVEGSSEDEREKILIEDDCLRVSLEEPLGCEHPNLPRAGYALSLLVGHPPSTIVNTSAVQPLASPYATRFPSPAASIISLAPSGPASGTSTPRSISPVASFSSTRSRTNCNNVGGALNAHDSACGISATSVPFPSSFSPTASTLSGVGPGAPLRRPSIVRRRSSLGPSRLSMGSSKSAGDGGGLRQPRRSATTSVTGYFDCHPHALLSATEHAETTSDVVDTDTEMESDNYPTTTTSTPALDV